MSRRVCTSCGCNLFPDEMIEHPGFFLCLSCDDELIEDQEQEFDDEQWAHHSRTQDDELED